jgi:hypothetical protein
MKVEALYVAALIVTAVISTLTMSAANPDATLVVEVKGGECVGDVDISPPLKNIQNASQYMYVVEGLKPGDTASVRITITDLRRCRVEDVSGTTTWFTYGNKLHINIQLREGENRIRVLFSYTAPKKVYVNITATNPECVAELTANAPVNKVSGGWVIGPWSDGDMAEISAKPSDRCYIGGWMSGGKALTTSSLYNFQVLENITLTLSVERRGTTPPPSLIDFSIVSVRATGPGKIIVSTTPITTGVGTPLWQAILNPGTTLYIEAVPEGCGEFKGWRGMEKLKFVDTSSLTIITDPGYMDVEAVFGEMNPCPYVAIGPYRIMRWEDVPIIAAVVGGGSSAILVYRMSRAGARQRRAMEELMPKWSDEMLSSIAAYATGHPYGMIASLVKEYGVPKTPTEYAYIFRAYRDGKLADILQDMSLCDNPAAVLLKIADYSAFRVEYAAAQGYAAGRLLVAYMALNGYAPVTKDILYEWVGRMIPVNSKDDAIYNIELLWEDERIAHRQRQAIEEVVKILSREGMENLAQHPPKPLQIVLSVLEEGKCQGCGRRVDRGAKFCPYCGTRLRPVTPEVLEKQAIPKEEAKPAREDAVAKEGRPTSATCPHCGNNVKPGSKFCIKCGARVTTSATTVTTPSEGRRLKELISRAQKAGTVGAAVKEPAPEDRTPATPPDVVERPVRTRESIEERVVEPVQPIKSERVINQQPTKIPGPDSTLQQKQEGHAPPTPPKVLHEPEPEKTILSEEQVPRGVDVAPPLPTPARPKQTTPIPSMRPPTETNITAPKTTQEKPTPAPKPQTVETVKPIEQPSTPKTLQPVSPEPEPRILHETPKEVVEEQEVEWEPDEDLIDTLKAIRVDPREFKHEAVRLAASNLDERSFEKELFRTADRLVSKIEGLRPDSSDADALRLSLFKHLMGAAQEIRKLMRPPEPPRKAVAKITASRPEQAGRLEPSPVASEAPPSPIPPTQPRATVTPQAQPKPAIQHIEPENLQPTLPQPRAQATPTIQQIPKPETTQQETVDEYIPYESVLRGEFREKTVILLPIKRSALPTGLIAGMAGVLNLEGATKPPVRGAIAQTRTAYRANYTRPVRPSPSHPYVKKVIKAVSSGHGNVWIITEEMYSMDEVRKEFEDKGYRPVKARLDIEGSRKRLEKIMHPKHAEKLAFAEALIPWLADELETHGWEGVYKKLVELLGEEDGEEVYVTLTEVLKEKPEYPNKPLAASLGVLDEGE